MTTAVETAEPPHVQAAPKILPSELDHLSWSGIKTYQTCPNKFRLRYIEQVPEEIKQSSLLFGSAFHSAVERVQEAHLQGLNIPAVDDLLAVYADAFARESKDTVVQHCKDEDETSLRDLARRMLAAYAEYAALETTLPDT